MVSPTVFARQGHVELILTPSSEPCTSFFPLETQSQKQLHVSLVPAQSQHCKDRKVPYRKNQNCFWLRLAFIRYQTCQHTHSRLGFSWRPKTWRAPPLQNEGPRMSGFNIWFNHHRPPSFLMVVSATFPTFCTIQTMAKREARRCSFFDAPRCSPHPRTELSPEPRHQVTRSFELRRRTAAEAVGGCFVLCNHV